MGGGTALHEIVGLGFAIVTLAGLTVAIIYGDRTAQVIAAGGNAFTNSIRVATRNTRS